MRTDAEGRWTVEGLQPHAAVQVVHEAGHQHGDDGCDDAGDGAEADDHADGEHEEQQADERDVLEVRDTTRDRGLVRADQAELFASHIAENYHKVTGLTPSIYVCQATNGAEVL